MFNVDIERGNYSPLWNCGLGDTRTEQFRITKLGQPLTFTNPTIQLNVKKGDGTFVHQVTNISYAEGVITIIFDRECFTAPGVVAAELLIIENGRTTTSRFFFYVRKTLDGEIIDSFDKVQLLEELEIYLAKAYQDLNEYAPRLQFLEENNISLNNRLEEAEQLRKLAEDDRNLEEGNRRDIFNNLKGAMDQATSTAVNTNNAINLAEEERVAAEIRRNTEHESKMSEASTAIGAINSTDATVKQNETNRGLTFDNLKGNMESATSAAIAKEKEIEAEEVKRKEAETKRAEDEAIRKQAEAGRDTAEQDRVNEFNTLKTEFEAIKTENETSGLATKVADNASSIAEIVKYNENSNIDLDGNTHETLQDRLQADNVILLDRMNNASYLPYESNFVSATNSFEGRTKENVVKGRTLQNLEKYITAQYIISTGYGYRVIDLSMLKPNSVYTIIPKYNGSIIGQYRIAEGGEANSQFLRTDININSVFTLKGALSDKTYMFLFPKQGQTLTLEDCSKVKFMILEGDYTNQPIPSYFEGIKSVNEDTETMYEVSCGKNLFSMQKAVELVNDTSKLELQNGTLIAKNGYLTTMPLTPKIFKPSTQYTLKYTIENIDTGVTRFFFRFMHTDGTETVVYAQGSGAVTLKSAFGKTVKYISISYGTALSPTKFTNIQLEEGATATTYEPYVEDRKVIKMKNLRGIGSVADTSDGVRRVGKVVLDGSVDEGWVSYNAPIDGTTVAIVSITNVKVAQVLCDKIPYSTNIMLEAKNAIRERRDSASGFVVRLLNTQLTTPDIAGFKAWLQANPITVYYELATPTTEENTMEQLRTYDNVTNIFTEGSVIEPAVSCKVPSNVQVMMMSLQAENEELNNEVATLQATEEENNLVSVESSLEQDYRLSMLELGI